MPVVAPSTPTATPAIVPRSSERISTRKEEAAKATPPKRTPDEQVRHVLELMLESSRKQLELAQSEWDVDCVRSGRVIESSLNALSDDELQALCLPSHVHSRAACLFMVAKQRRIELLTATDAKRKVFHRDRLRHFCEGLGYSKSGTSVEFLVETLAQHWTEDAQADSPSYRLAVPANVVPNEAQILLFSDRGALVALRDKTTAAIRLAEHGTLLLRHVLVCVIFCSDQFCQLLFGTSCFLRPPALVSSIAGPGPKERKQQDETC